MSHAEFMSHLTVFFLPSEMSYVELISCLTMFILPSVMSHVEFINYFAMFILPSVMSPVKFTMFILLTHVMKVSNYITTALTLMFKSNKSLSFIIIQCLKMKHFL